MPGSASAASSIHHTPSGKSATARRRRLDGEPRLADAAGPGERQQARGRQARPNRPRDRARGRSASSAAPARCGRPRLGRCAKRDDAVRGRSLALMGLDGADSVNDPCSQPEQPSQASCLPGRRAVSRSQVTRTTVNRPRGARRPCRGRARRSSRVVVLAVELDDHALVAPQRRPRSRRRSVDLWVREAVALGELQERVLEVRSGRLRGVLDVRRRRGGAAGERAGGRRGLRGRAAVGAARRLLRG